MRRAIWRLGRGNAATACIVLALAATTPAAEPEPPNIIIIQADQLGAHVFDADGDNRPATPAIDELAAQGVRFTKCYTPTPQTAPARASLLTGQYPHTHGVTTDGRELSAYSENLSGRLKKVGYRCGFVGDWALGDTPDHKAGFGFGDDSSIAAAPSTPEDWLKSHVWINGVADTITTHVPDWETQRAIKFLEEAKGEPFLLWLAYHGPGEPLAYPPGKENRYPPASLTLPVSMQKEPQLPNTLKNAPAWRRFHEMPNREHAIREARSKYAAMVAHLDENVGRLLRKLDELDIADHTIVVLTATGGLALGEHQLFGDGPFFYDTLARVPLVIRAPGQKPGAPVDRLCSLVDIAPTMLDFAGLTVPVSMEGQSLRPVMQDPRTRRHADERYFEYHKQAGHRPPAPPTPPVVTAPPVRTPPAPGAIALPTTGPAALAHHLAEGPHPGTMTAPTTTRPSPWTGRTPFPPPGMTQPAGVGTPEHPRLFPATRPGVATHPAGVMPPVPARPIIPGQPLPAEHPPEQNLPPHAVSALEPSAPPPPPPAPPPPDFVCPARGLMSPGYKYVDYLQDSDLLFDLRRDPLETRNAATDGLYRTIMTVLQERLTRWKKDTRDQPAMQ